MMTENEYVYCRHLVGFLDLVGQKEHLRRLEGVLDRDHQIEELFFPLKRTVGAIREFRNHFKTLFETFANRSLPENIPEEVKEKFLTLRGNSRLGIQHFSDSVVVWTPIHIKRESDLPQVLNAIFATLVSTALAIPAFLSKEVPIRGGIEIEGGITIEPGGEELYGPALNHAYHLESVEAKYPRVLVGPNTIRFLNSISSFDIQDKIVREVALNVSEMCKSCITQDYDGRYIVHFLGPAMKKLAEDFSGERDFIELALIPSINFIQTCEKKFGSNSDLGQKYSQLHDYFSKYMGLWGL